MFDAALKSEMIKLQVEDSGGKVFYSRLYPDCQIPAEFEFDETTTEKKDSDELVLPTNVSEVKSVMYKIDHKVNGKVFSGDAEIMQMMDEWYDTLKMLEQFSQHKNLVGINGMHLRLIEDFIDEETIIFITQDAFKKANDSLRHD